MAVICPTDRDGIAAGVVQFLADMGLLIGQSIEFFDQLNALAEAANAAQRVFDRLPHLFLRAKGAGWAGTREQPAWLGLQAGGAPWGILPIPLQVQLNFHGGFSNARGLVFNLRTC
jgi:hypothetical protein